MFHKRTIEGNLKPLLEIFESCLLKAYRIQHQQQEMENAKNIKHKYTLQQDCEAYTLQLINAKIAITI